MNLAFHIERWAAWAAADSPDTEACIETASQWQAWSCGDIAISTQERNPALPFVAPMLRRRLSRLSRLALKTAYMAAGENHALPTVFCSRHGEIHRTRNLLGDLAAGERLSPMAFSLSVHNTASGLYSIASGNTAPSTAIAAGRDTLAMAVIEAAGLLLQRPQVLLVFADEPLPEDYREFADEPTAAFGLALLLNREQGEVWTLAATGDQPDTPDECMGLALLRTLASGTGSITTTGERHGWKWSRA